MGIENPKAHAGGPDDTVFIYNIDHCDQETIKIGQETIERHQPWDTIKTAYLNNLYRNRSGLRKLATQVLCSGTC